MPIFSHRNEVQNQPPPPPPPQPAVSLKNRTSESIFRRSRDEPTAPDPVPTLPPQTSHNGGGFGSFFGNRRSSVERDTASISSNGSNGNVLHRGGRNSPPYDDSAIRAARQKVSDAESAERNADEALIQARAAVREARDHVGLLERVAEEE